MGYLSLNDNNLRILAEENVDFTVAVIISIGGVVVLLIAIFCYCRKRRNRQAIQFEVFTN